MVKSAAFEWGGCPCGGRYDPRLVEVRMTVQGSPLTLEQVAQGACPNCSGRVYKAETLGRIEQTMAAHPLDRRVNRFPV
jgi:hypothetical protein